MPKNTTSKLFKVNFLDSTVKEIKTNSVFATVNEVLDRTYCLVSASSEKEAESIALEHLFGNKRTTEDMVFRQMTQNFQAGTGTLVAPVLTKTTSYLKEKFSYCGCCQQTYFAKFKDYCKNCTLTEKQADAAYKLLDTAND